MLSVRNLKNMSSVRIVKTRRQSEFEKHVFSPNCKNVSSVQIWKEIRSDDVLFKFGLKTCFSNSEWRRDLFFSDWRRAFKIRIDKVFSTYLRTDKPKNEKKIGLTNCRTEECVLNFRTDEPSEICASEWRHVGMKTVSAYICSTGNVQHLRNSGCQTSGFLNLIFFCLT